MTVTAKPSRGSPFSSESWPEMTPSGELEKDGWTARSKLELHTGHRPPTRGIPAQEARLFCCESDGAGGETFKVKFAFGVCESGAGRGSGKLHEGMRNGMAGNDIHDGTL